MIVEWVLILTLVSGYGNAITTVVFDSKQACVTAGETWIKTTYPNPNKKKLEFGLLNANYICVAR